MTILTNVSVPADVSEVGGVNRRSPTGKLRRCAAAPCTCRDRVVRDVSCVTCRACDVARDRSIGRESGGGRRVCPVVEEILPKFLLLLRSAVYTFSFIRKSFLHVFLHNIFLAFRQSGSPWSRGPKSAPFSYTCPNYQLFLGKSSGFLTIQKNRVRSRTRVQTFGFLILPSWIYQARTSFAFQCV